MRNCLMFYIPSFLCIYCSADRRYGVEGLFLRAKTSRSRRVLGAGTKLSISGTDRGAGTLYWILFSRQYLKTSPYRSRYWQKYNVSISVAGPPSMRYSLCKYAVAKSTFCKRNGLHIHGYILRLTLSVRDRHTAMHPLQNLDV